MHLLTVVAWVRQLHFLLHRPYFHLTVPHHLAGETDPVYRRQGIPHRFPSKSMRCHHQNDLKRYQNSLILYHFEAIKIVPLVPMSTSVDIIFFEPQRS